MIKEKKQRGNASVKSINSTEMKSIMSNKERKEIKHVLKTLKKNQKIINDSPHRLNRDEKTVINLMTYNRNIDEILIKQREIMAKEKKLKKAEKLKHK